MSEREKVRGGMIVGVDGSPHARAALEFAYRDAARRGAPLWIVAAYSPPEYTQIWLETGIGADPVQEGKLTTEVRAGAQSMADEVCAAFAGESPPSVEVVVVAGLPARVLVELSEQAALLVLASRGHGGFASMLLGSVSLQCMLHARCPVTVVHTAPADRASEQADREAEPVSSPLP